MRVWKAPLFRRLRTGSCKFLVLVVFLALGFNAPSLLTTFIPLQIMKWIVILLPLGFAAGG